jgi:PEP-CTERM motif
VHQAPTSTQYFGNRKDGNVFDEGVFKAGVAISAFGQSPVVFSPKWRKILDESASSQYAKVGECCRSCSRPARGLSLIAIPPTGLGNYSNPLRFHLGDSLMRKTSTTITSLVAAILFVTCPDTADAVFDNFADMNDTANPAWVHLDGLVASSGQTWDATTGKYRMTAPNNGFSNLGFVGSYVPTSYTDVTVMADIVSFVDGPTQGGPFALAARLDGNNAFNTLKGYAYAYEPQSDAGNGEFALYRINGASLADLNPIGVENVDWIRKVTLDPNKDYTFKLSVQGTLLRGEVREVGGPLVAYQTATDATYASGFSGLFAYSQVPIPPVDVTWDNFSTQVPEPASCLLVGLGTAIVSLGRRRR